MRGHIFISYSFFKQSIAEVLADTLESAGLKCWLAARDLPVGVSKEDAVAKAVSESQGVLLIIDPNSAVSSHVFQEIKLAASQGKIIFSVMIEKTELSRKIRAMISLSDFYDATASVIEEHLIKIKESVLAVFRPNEKSMAQSQPKTISQHSQKYPFSQDFGMEHPKDTRFKIYVSHDPADAVYTEELYQYLRDTLGSNNDLRIYGTRGGIHSLRSVRTCEVFVLMVSRNSFDVGGRLNEPVSAEYAEARTFNRNIVCLFLEGKNSFSESLPRFFSGLQDRVTLIFPENNRNGINFNGLLESLEKHGARLVSVDTEDTGREYDVFISCKSEDNKFARNVCNFLQTRGLKVFFSKETLPKLGSAAYRRQITKAIDNSRHMVVVTSKSDYVNSKWVEFEWGLFLDEQLAERKDGNLLTVLAGGMTVKELPIDLRNVEAIPLVPGEIERLIEYVSKYPVND